MRRSRATAAALAGLVALAVPHPAAAYQTYGATIGGRTVTIKWSQLPVRYYVTDRGVAGVSASDFRDAAGRAFTTWAGVASAAVSAQFVGFVSADPTDEDGLTTLGFEHRPDLDRVLGATEFLLDNSTGQIVEAGIFFNSAFQWSVAAGGESGKFDLESIVVHETGHLFGLGHSDLGETELRAGGGRRVVAAESVLFPIAFSAGSIAGRTLRADDIAGISELYPARDFRSRSGSISGKVTKNGQGVFGAHVVAFNTQTRKLVGTLTLDAQGSFVIASLEPGVYILRAEPLDDADLDSFFSDDDIPRVDLSFRVGYADALAVVPAGGGSLAAEIKVVAK